MSRKITIEKIKKRIFNVHGNNVIIDESTYYSADKKARFIDVTYGEWWAQVKGVCTGRRHTDFKYVNFKKSKLLTLDKLATKINSVHNGVVKIADNQKYINSHKKMIFIDRDYGEWIAQPYSVLAGHCHPRRGHHNRCSSSRRSTILMHWKTGDNIVCVGSYERKVVEFLNVNKIDFEWQIPKTMPSGKTYYVDLFLKEANVWVEIKGTWKRNNGEISKAKWEWFHSEHPNSMLWMKDQLIDLGILK